MSHPSLDKAWAWFSTHSPEMTYARRESIHKTLAELEVELHRIDQAQYVPALPDSTRSPVLPYTRKETER